MFDYNASQIFIIIGIVAITAEILVGAVSGFELFVIGFILILSGLIGMFTSPAIAIICIIVFILLYLFFIRKIIKKSLAVTTRKTNVDSIIGRKAKVVQAIKAVQPGRIKIDGEEWRATAEQPIDEGKTVTIISVSGVTVTVV